MVELTLMCFKCVLSFLKSNFYQGLKKMVTRENPSNQNSTEYVTFKDTMILRYYSIWLVDYRRRPASLVQGQFLSMKNSRHL